MRTRPNPYSTMVRLKTLLACVLMGCVLMGFQLRIMQLSCATAGELNSSSRLLHHGAGTLRTGARSAAAAEPRHHLRVRVAAPLPWTKVSRDMCVHGILSGRVCCPNMCGRCGGPDCGSLPGGDSNCCGGTIAKAKRSCGEYAAPCMLNRAAVKTTSRRDAPLQPPQPFVGAPSAANFTLVFMWNFKIDEGRRAYLNRAYGKFFRFVAHVGGNDACNSEFVMVTRNRFRVAQYVCYGALMAQEPGAFGTLGFLFLADDVAICPTEMIAELSANPRVPRFSDMYNDRQTDALILEHVRDGPNSTFFAAGTPYKK